MKFILRILIDMFDLITSLNISNQSILSFSNVKYLTCVLLFWKAFIPGIWYNAWFKNVWSISTFFVVFSINFPLWSVTLSKCHQVWRLSSSEDSNLTWFNHCHTIQLKLQLNVVNSGSYYLLKIAILHGLTIHSGSCYLLKIAILHGLTIAILLILLLMFQLNDIHSGRLLSSEDSNFTWFDHCHTISIKVARFSI